MPGAWITTQPCPRWSSAAETSWSGLSGNTYLRLGDAYERLGRDDEARAAYERGVGQAEKFGHDGMADALRLALSELGQGA